jgi:hypothetical protein
MLRNLFVISLFCLAVPAFADPMVIDGEAIGSEEPNKMKGFASGATPTQRRQQPQHIRSMTEFKAKSTIKDKVENAVNKV